MEYFEKKPTWNYAQKVAIAVELDMTFSQVAKWNWDQRKKLGMLSGRGKDKKSDIKINSKNSESSHNSSE